MKEKPILFSGAMVRAILEGRKTKTRRVVKPQPVGVVDRLGRVLYADPKRNPYCPYGDIGDRLWVRETFTVPPEYFDLKPGEYPEGCDFIYKQESPGYRNADLGTRWVPSIFMPRWASRITLEITDVRVERLQEISETDAAAEGYPYDSESRLEEGKAGFTRSWFCGLWDSINGEPRKDGVDISWAANPWVWVVSFQVLEK